MHHRFQADERVPLILDKGTHEIVTHVWNDLHQPLERILRQGPHNRGRKRLSRGCSLVTLTDEEFAEGVSRLENVQNTLIALGRDKADLDGSFLDEIEQIPRIARPEQDITLPVVTYLKKRFEFAKLRRRQRFEESQITDVPDRIPMVRDARPHET